VSDHNKGADSMRDMTSHLEERFPLATITRTGKASYKIAYVWRLDDELVFYALCDERRILEIQQA